MGSGTAETTKVALVTGASRGLGRAMALSLAEAGFDVAITARTLREGEGRAEPNSVRSDVAVPIPGSLETTAADIEARGRKALPVRMDLLVPDEVLAVPRTVLDAWGRIDVLCNNAIFQGGGTMDAIADLTSEAMERLVRGNYVHQVLLIQQVLPHMVERGSGRIVNMVSGSARLDPPAPPGQGGWGIAYSASKAAFGRVAGGLNAELASQGVHAFNVDPGNVVTEKRRALAAKDAFEDEFGSDPPEATAAVVAWLATSPDAPQLIGRWIRAPKLAVDLGLQ